MNDRFISYTYKNWSFGIDFSGNIVDKDNNDFFIKSCEDLKEIHLAIVNTTITPHDHHNREHLRFDHHFSALVAALKILSKGGNLIRLSNKMFNAVNISLMYFLNLVFDEVHLFKPTTAPMTGSEFYIIGINFKKDALAEKYIEEMRARVGPKSWEKGIAF